MLIKTLIKKPLLVLDNGLKLKIESKIIIDRYFRKIRYLVVKNENQIFYIDTQKIFNTKNDAIVIKKFEFLILKNDFEYKATHFLVDINSMVYNTCGEFICHIENFEIDLNFKILQIIFKTQNKNLSNIISANKKSIVVSAKKQKSQSGFPKNKPEYKNILVNHTILERKTSNINFLQGRMVTKDITNFLGEIIIKKNTIITKSHIEKAKKFYKVRELIYFSKTISA